MAEGVGGLNSFEESWRRRRAQYEQWLAGDDHALLVAEREGRLVGYAMLSVEPAAGDVGLRARGGGDRDAFGARRRARGAGWGRRSCAAAERWARGRGADTLTVGLLHTNEGALRFYEREGFGSFYLELARDLR